MLFLTCFLLSLVLLIGYLVLAVRHFRRPAQLFQSATRAAVTVSLAAFPVWCIALTWRLIVDPSSTAVIAVYCVPLLAAALAGVVFAAIWSIVVLVQLARSGRRDWAGRGRALLALLVLTGLAILVGSAVREELLLRQAERRSTSPARLAELFARETVKRDTAIVAAIAANLSTPREILSAIAVAPRPEWRKLYVGRLRSFLLAPSPQAWSVAAALAGNPNTPLDALRRLVGRETKVAFRLAQNPATPPDLLTLLASREDVSVRSAVAANPRTPTAVLAILARNGERSVRQALATNTGAPPAALSALAKDADRGTRLLVASNPSTPRSTRELLAQDPDEKVRTYAARTLQNPRRR